jgi:hypothetical protein
MSEPPYEHAVPPAASAIEALRGIGYNILTAIADLVDNSISAGAKSIWIDFEWNGLDSSLSIRDDGRGMNATDLAQAMVLGSRSPLEERTESDLGRFGLGLKTASFSQCRRLIVTSKADNGLIAVRQWDLDYVLQHNEWRVIVAPTEGSRRDIEHLRVLPSGTVVRWEAMDHLVGTDAKVEDLSARSRFFRTIEEVRAHLGMVFHRFLSERPALTIFINGTLPEHRVRPWDPFCQSEPATQQTPDQILPLHGLVTGFTLPHRDKFSTPAAYEGAAGPNGWGAHQGFFVYRNRRLLLAGGWLGLGRDRPWQREEQFRLARLRLDIPNSTDRRWQIDVKKAVARPPAAVRPLLTDLAEAVRDDARRVFAHRGSYKPRQTAAPIIPTWHAARDVRGRSTYTINREHPLVNDLLARDSASRSEIKQLLKLVEATVPVQQVWLDIAERPDQQASASDTLDAGTVTEAGKQLWHALVISRAMGGAAATAEVLRTEPFNQFPHLKDEFLMLEQGKP